MQLTATWPPLTPLQNTQSWASLKMLLVINTLLISQPVSASWEQSLWDDGPPPRCREVTAMLSEQSSSLTLSYSAHLTPATPRADAGGKPQGFAGSSRLCQGRLIPHLSLEMPLLCTKPSEHRWSPKSRCSCRDAPA